MKLVLLAGGFGTRLSEETHLHPKPMVHIGGRPLLWHVMTSYAAHGINEFIICCGYKADKIKEYFLDYQNLSSDMTVNFKNGDIELHNNNSENWTVTLIDTGLNTLTGGRLKRVAPYIGDETFCLTYGDGLSDVNITEEIKFHKRHGKLATVMAVKPPGRFGVLDLEEDRVGSFSEKPSNEIGWISGGFFVLEPDIIEYIDGDQTSFEEEPLRKLADDGELMAFKHNGFWKPCDTLRDKNELEKLWAEDRASWLFKL